MHLSAAVDVMGSLTRDMSHKAALLGRGMTVSSAEVPCVAAVLLHTLVTHFPAPSMQARGKLCCGKLRTLVAERENRTMLRVPLASISICSCATQYGGTCTRQAANFTDSW